MNAGTVIGFFNANAGLLIDLAIVGFAVFLCAVVAGVALWGARSLHLERLLAPRPRATPIQAMYSGAGVLVGLGALGTIVGVLPLPFEGWIGSALCAALLSAFVLIGIGSRAIASASAADAESLPTRKPQSGTTEISNQAPQRRAA
jgi:hypothetical protein